MKIHKIIDRAIELRSSDIHLTDSLKPTVRVNGILKQLDEFDISNEELLDVYVGELLNKEQLVRLDENKNLDTSISYKEQRIRVHIYKQMGVNAIALRLIPMEIPEISDLALPTSIEKLTKIKSGLVLIIGVTGSGKSTTLAALLKKINNEQSKHIITIEDPIEYIHKHDKSMVNQREVGSDVNSFADAVREAMREDPDVLLLGELRDLDTIKNAITMAETGHLVFATLHSKSVAEAPDRIIDIFPGNQQEQIRVQLANSIKAIVSQELLPKIGGGRVPNCEVLFANDAVRNIIKNKGNVGEIISTMNSMHRTEGAQTKMQSLAILIRSNLISIETAMSGLTISEIKELERLLR